MRRQDTRENGKGTKERTRLVAIGLGLALVLASLVSASAALAAGPEKPAHAPDRVLVRFKSGAPGLERAAARSLALATKATRLKIVPDLEVLTLDKGTSVEQTIKDLSRNPHVQYAEPDFVLQATAIPDDPYYASQWGLHNAGAEEAWDSGAQNAFGMVVAIIDTGIDMTHPDLQQRIWVNPGEIAGDRIDNDRNGYVDDVNGWDFAYNDNAPSDGNGHGTHVAGTVGARGNDATGVAGVMWNVQLMPLKFLNDAGSGLTSNAIRAVQYATEKGVRVSNNSWGGGSFSQALYDAIKASRSVGHVFVAAAGNGGTDGIGDNNDVTPMYPASYALDNIVSVAAADRFDARAAFSNYGKTSVDLGAPGVSILSTVRGSQYAYYSGTSMAAPHVAGAAAMLYNLRPWWTHGTLRNTILASARPLASLAGKTATGGTLDLGRAIELAELTATPDESGFKPPLRVLAHVQGIGDTVGREDEWVGTKGQARRLEGFSVNFREPAYTPDLRLEYMCHVQGVGDTDWKPEGSLCGTRGQSRRLEGFAIRLTGAAAEDYAVVYSCHVQGLGDRGPYSNGAFCGTRGQARRIEAMNVYVLRLHDASY